MCCIVDVLIEDGHCSISGSLHYDQMWLSLADLLQMQPFGEGQDLPLSVGIRVSSQSAVRIHTSLEVTMLSSLLRSVASPDTGR